MSALILDLVPNVPTLNDLSESTRHELTRWIREGGYSEDEIKRHTETVERRLAFQPLFLTIKSAGLYDVAKQKIALYVTTEETDTAPVARDVVIKHRPERDLVAEIITGMWAYDTLITFNGRSLGLPLLRQRARFFRLAMPPAWPSGRPRAGYSGLSHIDLYEEGSGYGAVRHPRSLTVWFEQHGGQLDLGNHVLPKSTQEPYERILMVKELFSCYYPAII